MKRAKRLILLITAFVYTSCFAQQEPQLSHYMYNYFVFNPAVAGTRPYFVMRADARDQWVGMEGHPRTQMFSIHAPALKNKIGVGGYILNDVVGPLEKKGVSLSYAYHIKVQDHSLLSLGLAGSYYTSHLDPDKMQFDNGLNTDNELLYSALGQSYPNFGFGTYFQDKKYCIGLSVPELLTFTRRSQPFAITPARHFYAFGEYNFRIRNNYIFTPSAMIKYVERAPLSCEVNAMVLFFNKVNTGVTYRYGDALVTIVGYSFRNNLHIAYSYDMTATHLTSYTSGTHEISIGYYGKQKKEEENCAAYGPPSQEPVKKINRRNKEKDKQITLPEEKTQ